MPSIYLFILKEGKTMKILLIRPRPHRETIGLQHVMICEPLELEYIAGNIERPEAQVEIIDMIIEKKPLEYFIKSTSLMW